MDDAGTSATSEGERVQKILASAGIGSRRACERLIAEGRVRVDGRTVRLGERADGRRNRITVDDRLVDTNPLHVHYLVNKPRGVVTTAADPQGRPTVVAMVPAEPRVFPVGRLDQDTEGLILLTNDGELAERMTHPRYEVERVYVAKVRGRFRGRHGRMLRQGVELDDGIATVRRARALATAADESLVEVVMTEGRNREVRRLLGAVGLPVQRLARVRFGSLELGDLTPGSVRPLRGSEVRDLYADVRLGEEPDVPGPEVAP